MRVSIALLSALYLTACGTDNVVVQKELVPVNPPAQMFTCTPEPGAPAAVGMTDPVFAAWVAALMYAGRDCREALAEVKGWIDGYNAKITPAPTEEPKPWWKW